MSRPKSENRTNDWKGYHTGAVPVPCPKCKTPNDLELYYYIDASTWTDFEQDLRSHDGQTFECRSCGNEIRIRGPLILDMPQRDLIVFATYGGDNGGVETGFRQFFEKMAPYLPPEAITMARKRPFTFVHGRRGLLALLDYFHDKPIVIAPDDGSQAVGDAEFSTLQGYIYGKLFFYFAGQLPVQDLVGFVIGAALDLETCGHASVALMLLQGVAARIGNTHPWLSHELGRLLLICGQAAEAKVWLLKAAERRHSWHTVTASFMDATPTRREDGDLQAATLPHAMPAERLGAITTSRHTVLGYHPADKDLGLWDFSNMSQAAIPAEYTLEHLIDAHAFALGSFDRHACRELVLGQLREATQVGWHRVHEVSWQLLRHPEADQDAYWEAYVAARWGIGLDVDISEKKAVRAAVEAAHTALEEINRQLSTIPGKGDENPNIFTISLDKGEIRFFLINAARHIRKDFLQRLNELSGSLVRDLRHLLWRSADEVVDEAVAAIGAAEDLEELVACFRVFLPACAERTADALRYSCEGLDEATSVFLGQLKQFSNAALEESISIKDLEYLSAGSTALDAHRGCALAKLLRRFVDRVRELGPKEVRPDYCLHRILDNKCPVCLEHGQDMQWDIINISARPVLEARVKNGQAVIPRCKLCAAELPRRGPLLYCNPGRNLYLLLCPDMEEEDEKRLSDWVSEYFGKLPLQYRDNRPQLAICSDYFPKGFRNGDEWVAVCRVRSPMHFLWIVRTHEQRGS